MNDRDIARQIARGDAEATEEFVRTHYQSVYRFMRHLTRQVEDSEDLTQQAFVMAKQRIATYRGDASLRTWLHRVAFHEYTHWKRAHRTSQRLDRSTPYWDAGFDVCVESAVLAEALGHLSEQHRNAFLLFEVQELSIAEAAHVLRVPQATFKSRLFKARKHLCSLMTERKETHIETKNVLKPR
ncbi:MAG: RNA polymerase sigma factor [Armatimonadetes bacterium]|nr:RNA polymerase sigma factor [Armatimonadota bacterium]